MHKSNLNRKVLSEITEIITLTKEEADKCSIQFIKLRNNTIKELVNYGVKDLPMLERVGHVRENILTERQAKELGFSTKNKHFHGLGVKTYLEIIISLDKPLAIYRYTNKGKYNKNNFIVVAPVKINNNRAIIPIEINNRGQYNHVEIDFNKIKSIYSKDNSNYIKNMLSKGKIKEIFTGSDSQQTPPDKLNISQNKELVNNDISNK